MSPTPGSYASFHLPVNARQGSRRSPHVTNRLVLVGAGAGALGPMTRLVGGLVRMRLLRQPIAMFLAAVRTEDLEALTGLMEAGKLRPAIDRTYSLEQVPEALRYVESGNARGPSARSISPRPVVGRQRLSQPERSIRSNRCSMTAARGPNRRIANLT